MKAQLMVVIALFLLLGMAPVKQASADSLAMPKQVTQNDLKPNLPQPYIVKKGDTLWDIAEYFLKDPYKWLKIWESNLYITNPDLIYPGNEIWFDAERGSLSVSQPTTMGKTRPQPQLLIKPVERLEPKVDASVLLTALRRQDFIRPDEVEGVGYILDSEDERLNYGANDRLYLKLKAPANDGDVFDVFRTGDPIHDPDTGKLVGVLVNHLGQLEVTSESDGIYRGVVLETFEELSRGDRLKPAKIINTRIKPTYPAGDLRGKVLYIRNNAAEAGQNQVIGISLGLKDGLKPGTTLSIHRAGRLVTDRVSGKKVRLPEEKIGEVLVLVPQQDASLAFVSNSSSSINVGDAVRNKAGR